SGLRVQQPFYLMWPHALLRRNQVDNRRVQVAASGSHYQTLDRRHTHGSVDRFPVTYGRGRAAVAKMQRDHVSLLPGQSAQQPVAISNVAMRCAVESVAPDAVPSIKMVRHRVQVRALRYRGVKRCVENRNLRLRLAKEFPCGLDAANVLRV